MAFRLAHVPLVDLEHTLTVGGADVTLRSFQPVVWVRLVLWGGTPAVVAFPAVVDTGNNHSFLIPGPLFRAFTRLDPADLRPMRGLRVNDIPISAYGFNLDLLRLRDGLPADPERVAGRLQTGQGVTVVPDHLASLFPRLPVLGVRCLTVNRVRFALHGDARPPAFTLSQGSWRAAPADPA